MSTIPRDERLARLERDEIIVIDVRPEPEYAAGHLPEAVSVPPTGSTSDRFDELDQLPTDRDVAAHCRGPYCVYADHAVRRLHARGRSALRLEDGMPEWRMADLPVETATG